MSPHGPLFVALTADVDPDANRAVAGRADAVTRGDACGKAHTDACLEGLRAMVDLLSDAGLPATFFHEGRTLEEFAARAPDLLAALRANATFEHGCHGWRHEDFAGRDSGVPLGPAETRRALHRAGEVFRESFGRPPTAFRAPYCRLTPALTSVLADLGYLYDASETRTPSADWPMQPYRLSEGLWELALCRWRDRRGGAISCYLWQLFEGRRPVDDYVALVDSLADSYRGGLLQLALHPWHLIVSERNERLPAGEGVRKLADLLERLAERGHVAFTTAGGYLCRVAGAS